MSKEQLDLFQVPAEPVCDLAELDSDPAYQRWLLEQAESFCEFDSDILSRVQNLAGEC